MPILIHYFNYLYIKSSWKVFLIILPQFWISFYYNSQYLAIKWLKIDGHYLF
jgi:hypothetical protein